MANRRMLSKSISTSRRVNLLDDFEKLLFTWMIPHSDDFGRLDGDPEIVKAIAMPLSKKNPKEFEKALGKIAEAGLIGWYETDHQCVIEVFQFDQHQVNLHKRTASRFPDFRDDSKAFPEFLGESGSDPRVSGKVRHNRTELNRTEPKGTEPNCAQRSALSGEGCERFEKFWSAYPKKKSKGTAENAWVKLRPSEQLLATMLATIERATTSVEWTRDNGQYIPHPASWLNAKGWEDEYTPISTQKGGASGDLFDSRKYDAVYEQ